MTDTPLSDDVVERVAVVWLAKEADADEEWATKFLRDCRNEDHYGDCIKVPMACSRCNCDEALEFARAALEAARYGEMVEALKDARRTMYDEAAISKRIDALLSSIGASQP